MRLPAVSLSVLLAAALALGACGRNETAAPVVQTPAPAAAKESLSYEQAVAQAKARSVPLLVDFHAPWCYSCYFMATNVLTGPEWQAVEKKSVVVEVDADSPEGAALREKYGVKMLPSYLVLNADGEELGRILGEQTREAFYPQINQFLDSGTPLTALAAQVRDASPASLEAGRAVLKSYQARYDDAGGLQWFAALPAEARAALEKDASAALLLARLRFLQAKNAGDVKRALALGQQVLAGDLGCERAYELDAYLELAREQPNAKALIAAQRPAAEALVNEGVFGASPCADQRSAVLVLADIHAALGEQDARRALLEKAIAQLEQRIGDGFGKDRNLDDNLRVFHDELAALSGDYTRYDALMPKLIAAWPEDYVYAYRWGKSLLARGQPAEALAQLERAADKAYGVNRLQVAEQRVQALQALQREADARRVVAETLKANGPWFPDQAAKLKALLKQ